MLFFPLKLISIADYGLTLSLTFPAFQEEPHKQKSKVFFSITFLINLQATEKVLVTSVLSVLRPVSKPVGAVTFTGLWTNLLTTSRQSE